MFSTLTSRKKKKVKCTESEMLLVISLIGQAATDIKEFLQKQDELTRRQLEREEKMDTVQQKIMLAIVKMLDKNDNDDI